MILEDLSIGLIEKNNLYTGAITIVNAGMRVRMSLTHEQVVSLINTMSYKLNDVVRVDPRYGETFLPEDATDGT